MENEKVNKNLIDAMLGEESPDDMSQESNDLEGLSIIDLSSCRFAISPEMIGWDNTDVETIKKTKEQFLAARYELITTSDVTRRMEISDGILKDITMMESGIGLSIDYYSIRDDIPKDECALLAISDAITIYDWLMHQIINLSLQKNMASFIEDDNITFANDVMKAINEGLNEEENKVVDPHDPLEDYVPQDPNVLKALQESNLVQSFMDDHTDSGLISEI